MVDDSTGSLTTLPGDKTYYRLCRTIAGRGSYPRPAEGNPLEKPGSGGFSGAVHIFPVRVYYEDTDAAGIVYYANYLRFIERGRTEMMRVLGIDHSGLRREQGVAFAVRRCAIDYRSPARLDDVLEVRTRIIDIGGATLGVEQIVRRDGQDLALAELRLACINQDGRAVRLPVPVRDAVNRIFSPQPFPKGRD